MNNASMPGPAAPARQPVPGRGLPTPGRHAENPELHVAIAQYQNSRYQAATCVLPPASASYMVWLDSTPAARCAESERRGRVNRVGSVVADGPQDLGVTGLARHW